MQIMEAAIKIRGRRRCISANDDASNEHLATSERRAVPGLTTGGTLDTLMLHAVLGAIALAPHCRADPRRGDDVDDLVCGSAWGRLSRPRVRGCRPAARRLIASTGSRISHRAASAPLCSLSL